MYQICLKDLVFSGHHGANPGEKDQPQRLRFNLDLWCQDRGAGQSDCLADTVNWAQIRKTVRSIVENESYNLMEALADRIVKELLTDPAVIKITVTIDKLDAWDSGYPRLIVEAQSKA